ncbi:unnamed protein product [Urochloa decumbens]|uniref:F-box domain-containing protein n=1 Tax=Urochloa decumbens TaxID=240449 RepID=A0ABC8VHD9_9POAL
MDSPNPKRIAAAPVLPDDALVDILSRVRARTLCRSKCVSRSWRDLIATRLRCTTLPQTLEGFFYFFDGDAAAAEIDSNFDDGPVAYGHLIDTQGKPAPLASFSFLGNIPGVQEFALQSSCNGLLLFTHRRIGDAYNSLGYLVCNPATGHWAAVPSSGWKIDWIYLWNAENKDSEDSGAETEPNISFTYMIFDPAVSPHFQLVEFWSDDAVTVDEVHTYSSETGVWCKRTSQWSDDEVVAFAAGDGFANGMLHLCATSFPRRGMDHKLVVAVDGEGKNCRVIRGPEKSADVVFVGQSQGRLHYVTRRWDKASDTTELSVWVLEEYGAETWVLKHSVTFLHLFGRTGHPSEFEYSVVAIHPDRNLMFFFQHWDLKLKSYDMDSQEVCTLRTLGAGHQHIVPYVPYFAGSPGLAKKRYYCENSSDERIILL